MGLGGLTGTRGGVASSRTGGLGGGVTGRLSRTGGLGSSTNVLSASGKFNSSGGPVSTSANVPEGVEGASGVKIMHYISIISSYALFAGSE